MKPTENLCSLRWNDALGVVEVIDQTLLPHTLNWIALDSLDAFCHAIRAMQVRGAPLIGVTAAFGLARAIAEDASDTAIAAAEAALLATRPTAVNLRWALEQVGSALKGLDEQQRAEAALAKAFEMREEDIGSCEKIGEHGYELLRNLPRGDRLNIMTHCNAGWLATIEWGTALAPIYKAQAAGVPVHVWVSETRPRNQGANLTAWELQRAGVPCTVVADNSCGQLMRDGSVDVVIVGSDRTAANGDVCNKVGTYLKALAARANHIPFFVALPASTIDWSCSSGNDIPIEERDQSEVYMATGRDSAGVSRVVRLAPENVVAHNPAFDVTPAELVTALVTDFGACRASVESLAALHEKVQSSLAE